MKKLLGIVVLGLLWCNISFAYDSKMCRTLGLSLSECFKKSAECKKLLLSEKQCSEKIRKERRDENIKKVIKKQIDLEKERKSTEIEIEVIAPKYLCMQNDSTNKWELSINSISLKKPKSLFVGDPVKYFYIGHSCCPEKDKKFAMYDDWKLKWFSLIDQDLYFNILELSYNKVKHKKFSKKLDVVDFKKFNRLYTNKENSKKDHIGELSTSDTYFRDEEKFFYAANAVFKDANTDANNFLSLFDADCE